MAIERKFINKAITDHEIRQFIKKEMERAGVSQVILQKTPMATRIILYVRRPGIVVGKKGSSIKDLCDKLTAQFGVDNPQLDVVEVEKPELDAALAAEKIGKQIEIRGNIKQTLRFSLKEIMDAGAIGAEIRIAGKVVGKGGKAKTLKLWAGHLKKSGDPMHLVNKGVYTCFLKAGAIGITVKIVPPNVKFADTFDYVAIDKKLGALAGPAAEELQGEEAAEAVPSEDLEKKIDEKIAAAKPKDKKEKAAPAKETAKPKAAEDKSKKPAPAKQAPKKKDEKADAKAEPASSA